VALPPPGRPGDCGGGHGPGTPPVAPGPAAARGMRTGPWLQHSVPPTRLAWPGALLLLLLLFFLLFLCPIRRATPAQPVPRPQVPPAITRHCRVPADITWYHWPSQGTAGHHWVPPAITRYHRTSPGTIGHHKVPPDITGFHQPSQSITGNHWVPPAITRYHRTSPGTTGHHRAPLAITRYHQTSLGTTSHHRVPLDISGYHQPPLGTTRSRWVPPATVGYHQPSQGTTEHHWEPPAIIGNHQPSPGTTGHHWVPPAITRYHQPSQGTTSHHWEPPAITRLHQPSLGTTGHCWLPPAITRYHRPSPGTTGHRWVPPAIIVPPALLAPRDHGATGQGWVAWGRKDPLWARPHQGLALRPPSLPSELGAQARPSPSTPRDLAPSPGGLPTLPVQGASARAKAHPGRIWAGNHRSAAGLTRFPHIISTPFSTSSHQKGPKTGFFTPTTGVKPAQHLPPPKPPQRFAAWRKTAPNNTKVLLHFTKCHKFFHAKTHSHPRRPQAEPTAEQTQGRTT